MSICWGYRRWRRTPLSMRIRQPLSLHLHLNRNVRLRLVFKANKRDGSGPRFRIAHGRASFPQNNICIRHPGIYRRDIRRLSGRYPRHGNGLGIGSVGRPSGGGKRGLNNLRQLCANDRMTAHVQIAGHGVAGFFNGVVYLGNKCPNCVAVYQSIQLLQKGQNFGAASGFANKSATLQPKTSASFGSLSALGIRAPVSHMATAACVVSMSFASWAWEMPFLILYSLIAVIFSIASLSITMCDYYSITKRDCQH